MSAGEPKPRLLGFYPTVALGAIIIGLGQLGYTMFLPAVLEIEHELGGKHHYGALIISAFVAGMGLANLLYGFLASRFNNVALLAVGLLLFAGSCFLTSVLNNFTELLIVRFICGCGAGAFDCIVRALYRTRYQGEQLTMAFNWYGIFFAAFPLFGPWVGSLIIHFAGWREVPVLLGSCALVVALVLICLGRRLGASGSRETSFPEMFGEWIAIGSNKPFMRALVVYVSCFVAYQLVFTASPYVFMKPYNMTTLAYGQLMILLGVGSVLGNVVSIYMNRKRGRRITLTRGIVLGSSVAFVLLISERMDIPLIVMGAAVFLLLMSYAIVLLNSMAVAMDNISSSPGVASSMVGFGQMGAAALVTKGLVVTVGLGLIPLVWTGLASSAVMLCFHREKSPQA